MWLQCSARGRLYQGVTFTYTFTFYTYLLFTLSHFCILYMSILPYIHSNTICTSVFVHAILNETTLNSVLSNGTRLAGKQLLGTSLAMAFGYPGTYVWAGMPRHCMSIADRMIWLPMKSAISVAFVILIASDRSRNYKK